MEEHFDSRVAPDSQSNFCIFLHLLDIHDLSLG